VDIIIQIILLIRVFAIIGGIIGLVVTIVIIVIDKWYTISIRDGEAALSFGTPG
jgi:hypothetical protein